MNETTDIAENGNTGLQKTPQPTLRHELIIEPGGSVTLPCTHAITKTSPEFHEILQKTVPDDISNEISVLMAHRRPAYSPIQLVLCVSLFCGTMLLAWLFFPRSASPETIAYTNIENPYGIQKGRFLDLSKAISALITDEKKPQAAIQTASPHLEALGVYISGNHEQFCECRHLILDLANCERQIPRPSPGQAAADYGRIQALLKKAVDYEPDDFIWSYLDIELKSKLLLPVNPKNYGAYSTENTTPVTGRRIERLLVEIERLKEKTKPLLDQNVTISEKHLVSLDLIQTRLLIRLWHINGGETLPDDQGDPGVAEREQAWKIAKQYPEKDDFLAVQEYILDTLLKHDSLVNRIFFNETSLYDSQELKNTLSAIRAQLAKRDK